MCRWGDDQRPERDAEKPTSTPPFPGSAAEPGKGGVEALGNEPLLASGHRPTETCSVVARTCWRIIQASSRYQRPDYSRGWLELQSVCPPSADCSRERDLSVKSEPNVTNE